MATAITSGVEQAVTLATTVGLLTITGIARKLIIYGSDVDVYVVTGVADGAALPSTGRRLIPTSILPVELDISSYGAIGLAGASAGTCRVEVLA